MSAVGNSEFQISEISRGEQLRQASELYRSVFGYREPANGLSPRLLRSLIDNGGIVLGAVDHAGTVHGFIYGFTGLDENGPFHYSQAAAIDPAAQGKGLGRQLKRRQAEVARAAGLNRMRWTYDPSDVRNGHFNLNVLGASGVALLPDYYQDDGTDRILVEWRIDDDVIQREILSDHTPVTASAETLVAMNMRAIRQSDPARAAELDASLRASLAAGFDAGGQLVGCDQIDEKYARYSFRFPNREQQPEEPDA